MKMIDDFDGKSNITESFSFLISLKIIKQTEIISGRFNSTALKDAEIARQYEIILKMPDQIASKDVQISKMANELSTKSVQLSHREILKILSRKLNKRKQDTSFFIGIF